MPNITKIVITGGPCGGKSTALSRIETHFSELGYRVIFVNEAATEMITNGVAPWIGKNSDFQIALLDTQRHKEMRYEEWACKLQDDKVLLVCDRGALDNKAYMCAEDFASLLAAMQVSEIELRDQYAAVFHLVTAAKGAEAFYTTANNQARTESLAEAIAVDDRIISAWTGHPHFRVIDNAGDFDAKIGRLIGEIASFLGEPEPFEIERKFLIEYPDLALLESLPNCTRVDIIQTYLCSSTDGVETRVRQRGRDGQYVFTETSKRRVSEMKRIETERRIPEAVYLTLLMNADTSLRQIRKTRYCLSYENQYLEIDIYPFWKKTAIVEVELSDEEQAIVFPAFIHLIKEVTDDTSYSNRGLAETVPAETEIVTL